VSKIPNVFFKKTLEASPKDFKGDRTVIYGIHKTYYNQNSNRFASISSEALLEA
jgi:hypothetical protein